MMQLIVVSLEQSTRCLVLSSPRAVPASYYLQHPLYPAASLPEICVFVFVSDTQIIETWLPTLGKCAMK